MTDADDSTGDDPAGDDTGAPSMDPASAAREQLLENHAETLEAVLAAADAVVADWPQQIDGRPATTDRTELVEPLRAVLDETGVLGVLPTLLAAAVDAAGYTLPAAPVPAPPYVVITSTGPVLRGTVEDGRLVVRIDCFDVTRAPSLDGAVAYVRRHDTTETALSVAFE